MFGLCAHRPVGAVRACRKAHLGQRGQVRRGFVTNLPAVCRRDRVRSSTVAHASGLGVLLPVFLLAPFAVFLGPAGCLPLIFAAPFLFAIWALSAALTLATVIVTSVVALGGAAAIGYFVLPRAIGKTPEEMKSECESTVNKTLGRGPVIDVEKNPSVDDGYGELDKDLDDFDKTLRDRRRRP